MNSVSLQSTIIPEATASRHQQLRACALAAHVQGLRLCLRVSSMHKCQLYAFSE